MSKCWYCNNELTTGDNPKHFGICNKCYDEMFKSNDIIIRSFTNKIANLEAKLVEKEQTITNLIEDSKSSKEFLKKQLAEKEKEIDRLKQYENFVLLQQIQASKENINKLLENAFQNPVAINVNRKAIEQLEKIQLYLKDKNKNENWHNSFIDGERDDIAEFINQQIKELKGENK